MRIQFRNEIHPVPQDRLYKNPKTQCEIEEERSIYNHSLEWKSGQEFYLDTPLFRGKGLLYSKAKVTEFALKNSKYQGKEMIIRLVGHVKENFCLNDLFIGGYFEKGIKGLPAPFILKVGLQIARSKSPHFFIDLNTKNPYVAAPLLGLLDDLQIHPFLGRSASFWQDYDLSVPITEDWIDAVDERCVKEFQLSRSASPSLQRKKRQALRTMSVAKWPHLSIDSSQLIAFELADSALSFDDLTIKWKMANFIPISIDLKHYVNELPFSVFKTKKKSETKCSPIRKPSLAIPTAWQKQGLCDQCFPPKIGNDNKEFLFALTVDYQKKINK